MSERDGEGAADRADHPGGRPGHSLAPRPPLLAVALLSAAGLGYEVLLLRLFAIIQWHHFAYLAISVALLGFGAAGTFVTLGRDRLLAAYPRSFALAAATFALAVIVSFALAQRVPFNALEILWDPGQFLKLAAIYLLLFIPFFCAATALCLAYTRFGQEIPRLYSADILGAGVGSLAMLSALFLLHPSDALRCLAGLGLAATALSLRPPALLPTMALVLLALLGPWLLPAAALRLVPSQFKDLSQALEVRGARVRAERSSPLGVVTVVESPLAPFRYAPGLSLTASAEPPPQLGLFLDGQSAGAVTRFDGDLTPLAYLGSITSALPYRLLPQPRTLILGAGGGSDVLQALYHGARTVEAVELDGRLADLVQEELAPFSGRPFSAPGVRLQVAEARGFLARSTESFDLIQVALLDSFGTSAAGLGSLSESTLYTVEAVALFLKRLAPGGLLAFTRWVSLPPRDTLRLFATAIAALEQRGVALPGRQLALIRSWNTATLLVKNEPFTEREQAAVKEFCRAHSFDVAYLPGLAADEANSYNILAQDDFHAGAVALLGPDRQKFLGRYKFNLQPATDDRPYFFHFFKWRTLPEMLSLRQRGALPPLEWGYPVLVMALIQAVMASLLLILLPLALGKTRTALAQAPKALGRRLPLYFLSLGLGFMGIEIPLLHRFSLFLSHPLYAAAVVLAAFLVFAGLGARFSARLAPGVRWPFLAIGGLALAYLLVLPSLLAALMGLGQGEKVVTTILLIAPLAFCLGIPFPLGLASVAAHSASLLPWALSINGFASVVATLLATLLAIHGGYSLVVGLAISLYGLAAWHFPRPGPG